MTLDHIPIPVKTSAGVIDESSWRELQELCNQPQLLQKRKSERFPISRKFRLTPIENGKLLFAQSIDIIGKDLSRAGLGFLHKAPFNHRQVGIIFRSTDNGQFAVESEVLWTRVSPLGHYETGCRFVRKMTDRELKRDS